MADTPGQTGEVVGTAVAPGKPWDDLLTLARVLALHERSLTEHGGSGGLRGSDYSCVEAALGGAHSAEVYLEDQRFAKAGLVFAGYVLFYVVQRHCFVDGNKRTGWASAIDVLRRLGLGVVATDDEVVALIEGVISHQVKDGSDVVRWFAPRLFAIG